MEFLNIRRLIITIVFPDVKELLDLAMLIWVRLRVTGRRKSEQVGKIR